MNKDILKSLNHLELLAKIQVVPYTLPFGKELMTMRYQPGFHCFNTGEVFTEFPEKAAFADTE